MCVFVCMCISCFFLTQKLSYSIYSLNPAFVTHQYMLEIILHWYIELFLIIFFFMVAEHSTVRRYPGCLTSPLRSLEHILSSIYKQVSSGQIQRYEIGGGKGKCLCNFVIYCCHGIGSIFSTVFSVRPDFSIFQQLGFCLHSLVLQLNLSETFS